MVTVLKKGATKKNIRELLDELAKNSKSKGFDAYKYLGKIKLKNDALAIQNALRDEWE